MDFRIYEKINDNFRWLNENETIRKMLDKTDWVVTEKVHGANFSITIDAQNIYYGKRKEKLNWEDDFFGFQLMVTKLEKSFYALYEICQKEFRAERCIIYGELFGGHYPHEAVAQDKRLQPIQTGIYYSPAIEFYIFDIWIENPEDAFYLDYARFSEALERVKLLYAKAWAIQPLHKVLTFNTQIVSPIPALLGLPPLANPSWIEGVVIKPLENISVETSKGSVRPSIKIKNQQFLEADIYQQAQPWSFLPTEKQQDIDFIVNEIRCFLNENRVQSAISKIGALKPENKTEILEAVVEDTLESFEEKNTGFLASLGKDTLERIKNSLWKITRQWL